MFILKVLDSPAVAIPTVFPGLDGNWFRSGISGVVRTVKIVCPLLHLPPHYGRQTENVAQSLTDVLVPSQGFVDPLCLGEGLVEIDPVTHIVDVFQYLREAVFVLHNGGLLCVQQGSAE